MNVYAFVTPTVIFLLLLEIIICLFSKYKNYYSFQDTIANIATGIGNQCVNIAVAFFVFKWYGFIYQFVSWKIESTWYSLAILLLLIDFLFYWFHRLGHTVNVFWAAHMPHHSSEEFNLSVGVRASVTQRIFQFVFIDWVLVVMGYSPEMIYAMTALHLLAGYWHHTRLIKSLGFLERFIVTPSHHRVHHGVNPQYIDKNYAELIILWDKLFGTYEAEVEDVCYGITHPPRTWDPIFINFQYWKQLVDDAIATKYWWDKIRLWFMPLGWRPRDLEPVNVDPNVIGYSLDQQTKFSTKQFKNAKPYLVLQVLMGFGVLFVTTNFNFNLSSLDRFVLSSALFMMIINWSYILEGKSSKAYLELLRLLFMAISLMYILHAKAVITIDSWPMILISSSFGISFLLFSFFVKKTSLEGVASKHSFH